MSDAHDHLPEGDPPELLPAEGEDHGLSLDQLSQAYAEMLSQGEVPYETDGDEESAGAQESEPPAAIAPRPGPSDEPPGEVTPRGILEAMLFVGNTDNQPLTGAQVAALMRGVRPQEVDEMVRELNDLYAAEGRPYTIESTGAGYAMALRPEFSGLQEKFHGKIKEARLSQAALDVLAVVAYHQPVSRDDLDKMRGKPSGALLSQMVRRQLLQVERPSKKGAKTLYRTTDRFLDLFGLETLADLPRGQEWELSPDS